MADIVERRKRVLRLEQLASKQWAERDLLRAAAEATKRKRGAEIAVLRDLGITA